LVPLSKCQFEPTEYAVGGVESRNETARIYYFVGVAAVLPLAASAQSKIPRIGFMGNSTAVLEANLVDAFREGIRELGYEEGRNIVIEYRWAGGEYRRFSTLVAELIAAKVDLIVTAGLPRRSR